MADTMLAKHYISDTCEHQLLAIHLTGLQNTWGIQQKVITILAIGGAQWG